MRPGALLLAQLADRGDLRSHHREFGLQRRDLLFVLGFRHRLLTLAQRLGGLGLVEVAAADRGVGGHGDDFGLHFKVPVRRRTCTSRAVGNAQAAYDAALRYAKERVQFGQPIGKFQAVQFKLVDMLATLEQARLCTYYAAGRADRGEPIITEAVLAKLLAADGCNEVCQKALGIFGGYGLMNEYPVQRFLRDSYFPIVGGGASVSAAPGWDARPRCRSSASCRARTSRR